MEKHIENFIHVIYDFNTISVLFRICLAIILSGLIGMERSRNGRAAGFRTHMMVCVGACIASMTGLFIAETYGTTDVSRIAAQVISGIGFLGTGTILMRNRLDIVGLTTASCVWVTGTIGVALGYGFYTAAVLGGLLTFFIVHTLVDLESKLKPSQKEFSIYAEFVNAKDIDETVEMIKNENVLLYDIIFDNVKTNLHNGVAITATLKIKENDDIKKIMKKINDNENVSFAVLTNQYN